MEMDFEKICRTCLSGENSTLVSIFENNITDMSESESSSVIDLLTTLTNIKVSINDCLPRKICVPCMDELKICHLFRMKCENSDMILRKLLNENVKSNQIQVTVPKLSNYKLEEQIEMEDQKDNVSKFPEKSKSDLVEWNNLGLISIKEEIDYEPNPESNVNENYKIDDDATKIGTIDETECYSDEKLKMSDESGSETESRTMGQAYLPPENITDGTFPEKYVCISMCSYECTSANELTKHIRKLHIEGLTCKICEKDYSTKQSLTQHTKTHVLQWSLCSICGQKLLTKSMKTHLKGHKRDKWIKCDQCEKRFLKHSELRIHSILHHAVHHNYKCDRCNIKFPTVELRDEHHEMHNKKPRKHNCDLCSKTFTSSTKLTIHRRVHTGERPYKCEYCDKQFKQKCVLKSHLQTHTKERPVNCPVCTKTFITGSCLMRHVKRQHNDEVELVKTN